MSSAPSILKKPPLFTVLDRYLATQLFWLILFAVVLFSVIWLAPDTLFKLTQQVFFGQLSLFQATWMFLLHIPEVLQQTIPVAVLLGSIFLFQRLSQNYELIAMLAAGVTPLRILRSVLLVGLLFGVFYMAVEEWVMPRATASLEQAYAELDPEEVPDRNFLFVEKNHANQLAKFFMIGQIQKPELSDFIILYYEDSGQAGVRISRILRSKTGRWMPEERQWNLLNGIEYVLNEEGVYKDIRQFDEQQVRTSRYAARLLEYTRMNPEAMPWNQLRRFIGLLREGGQLQDVAYYKVRLWQKVTAPVAAVLFAVLGALLGMERIRANRTYGLTFGAVVIFVYIVMTHFVGSLSNLNILPVWLLAWMPLLAAVALVSLIQLLRPSQG